ncbi:hypothetical protein CEP52_007755 [Fusarium oligoseptatum]|uniref:Mid2 domain-containing protein n=1 Tax=Fusarium oligoseptatum TaxID=2604345 RepID=A0A428TLB6_9HYPO|nr:hypothetical protein CEP52_007755 [Fusarium oligoseptatum]
MDLLFKAFQLLLVSHLLIPYSQALNHDLIKPSRTLTIRHRNTRVQPRAFSTELSTCGYEDGDPDKVRTANDGYNCRINTRDGLWGFCSTTNIHVTDCRMAARCVDTHQCSDGCGSFNEDSFTTTCQSLYCSTDVLTFGVDQTYTHVACGASPITKHYYITPTAETTSTSTSSETIETSTGTTSAEATTQTTTNTADDSSRDKDKASGGDSSPPIGAIVGGVIGGLVLICGTVIAVVFLLRRGRDRKSQAPDMSQARSSPKPPDELGQDYVVYRRENAVELGG